MLKRLLSPANILIILGSLTLFSACTSGTVQRNWRPSENANGTQVQSTQSSYKIMGKGKATQAQMARYLTQNNPRLNPKYANRLASYYIEECAREGVNHDLAFAQMCHETNFLKFGGQVLPEQNNFAGIGALDGGARGAYFPSPRIGVRAQVQHLVAYASTHTPRSALVDPRFTLVKQRGCAKTVDQLAGKWASDKDYGPKLRKKLHQLWSI